MRKPHCIDCGKPISPYATRCGSCATKIENSLLDINGKNNPMFGVHKFGKNAPNYGNQHSETTKREMSKARCGSGNANWRGGITPILHLIRTSSMSEMWRDLVFHRDNFTCQHCGDNRGHNLNAHHIKALAKIVQENNITSLADVLRCGELWDIDNGMTLCEKCHRLTKNYGRTKKIKQQ